MRNARYLNCVNIGEIIFWATLTSQKGLATGRKYKIEHLILNVGKYFLEETFFVAVRRLNISKDQNN